MIKRKPNELFYDYCARRIVEQEDQKERLKRRIIWTSTMIVNDPNDDSIIPKTRVVQVRGTFDRSKGHRMPNSLYEKHRRERMLKKLRRRGVIPSET